MRLLVILDVDTRKDEDPENVLDAIEGAIREHGWEVGAPILSRVLQETRG